MSFTMSRRDDFSATSHLKLLEPDFYTNKIMVSLSWWASTIRIHLKPSFGGDSYLFLFNLTYNTPTCPPSIDEADQIQHCQGIYITLLSNNKHLTFLKTVQNHQFLETSSFSPWSLHWFLHGVYFFQSSRVNCTPSRMPTQL